MSEENWFQSPLQTLKPTDAQVPSLRDRFVWGLDACVCLVSLDVASNAKTVETLNSHTAMFKE